MPLEKHDLAHEFPELREKITELKVNNAHFHRLFNEYQEKTDAVYLAEAEVDPTTDDHLEEMKKQRLALKDELYAMLTK